MSQLSTKLHPLDPLTAAEINGIRELVTNNSGGFITGKFIFNSLCLIEPDKNELLPALDAAAEQGFGTDVTCNVDRRALALLIERPVGTVWEVVVNTKKMEIESWKAVEPGLQPTLSLEECIEAEKIVKADSGVQKRYRASGYKDLDLLVADPWSIGYYPDEPDFENRRLTQVFMFVREFPDDNHYAHPLDFTVVVDLNLEKVIKIEDAPVGEDFRKVGKVPIPRKCWNYDADILGKESLRTDLKPIQVIQPEGASFHVKGNAISWQNFTFRISFNYREGLVLHDIRYRDGLRTRPLFYRLSISEMLVPYGDPRPPYHRKTAFDVGDYGLGFCANSLELGCDCLGNIKYFDAVIGDHQGKPAVIKNAVCLHEEDAGILWKHFEYRTGKVCATRARRLVISFIVTFANYEYAFYWYFHHDGSISLEVKATGQLSTVLIPDQVKSSPFGTIVAPSVLAQSHQHIYAVRIDPMIDGKRNTVSTVDIHPSPFTPGQEPNPYGLAFGPEKTPLSSTQNCTSDSSPHTCRTWLISNSRVRNPINDQPVAWKLTPWSSGGSYGRLMADEASMLNKRANFCTKPLWVTKYRNSDELFAAGFYVNQSKDGQGLPKYIRPEVEGVHENLMDEDVVVWHVFGVTHVPRIEDFPIMNVESCGFSLKPWNFFNGNPALDVPPSTKEETKSKLACCE